jgi:hypothetical protein
MPRGAEFHRVFSNSCAAGGNARPAFLKGSPAAVESKSAFGNGSLAFRKS